ncbi:hypothetical protein [Kitasatospora sp. NPDC047058]|uniref:hypothetical protein n=1 Tax=Kitasatospora sp. NPDC047058 TaxID=3155620 RepID=UPI0033CCC342
MAWNAVLPTGRQEVRHGYTVDHLSHITRLAVPRGFWHTAGTIAEQLETAWGAIVEHLCSAETAPTTLQLLQAAHTAVASSVRDELHHHGYVEKNLGAGRESMPAYQRYWHNGPTPSPETRVIERAALTQIWPTLRPSGREALGALAATGDYALAAKACGRSQGTFNKLVQDGRRHFLQAWHEGEAPSKVWRPTRVHSRSGGTSSGHRRLTVSEVEELRERWQAGATITALAKEAGVADCTLGALFRGKYRPAPDPVA